MPERREWPKVSIVTPSFQQAQFLEQTIRSVLDQRYPNLEYLVMDGGSTDGSVEVIQRHARQLSYWVSEADGGQADAVNKGWQRVQGDILAYLNSDDFYLPGAIHRAVDYFERHPQTSIVYGSEQLVDAASRPIGQPVQAPPCSIAWLLRHPLPQPTMFFRREAFERVGWLDPSLHYVFDWEWNLRAAVAGVVIDRLPGPPVAAFRCWEGQKTAANFDKHIDEQMRMRDQLGAREDFPAALAGALRFSKAWAFLWPAYQYYVQGRMREARRLLQRAVAVDWRMGAHPECLGMYVRSLLGQTLSGRARKIKTWLMREERC